MRISIALLTHNEGDQFEWLMQALAPAAPMIEEIVVLDDFSDPACVAAMRSHEGRMPLRFFQRALKKNFARQRNHMKSLCRGDFIFYLDPDEMPPDPIVRGLPQIFRMMADANIDACTLPRFNFNYKGDRFLHPGSFDLEDFKQTALWEDQFRLLRNSPELYWTMPIHEYLTGMRRCYRFPRDLRYALVHGKPAGPGRKQMQFYKSFHLRWFHRQKNSLFKRLWRREIEWVDAEPPV